MDESKHYSVIVLNSDFEDPFFDNASGEDVNYELDLYGNPLFDLLKPDCVMQGVPHSHSDWSLSSSSLPFFLHVMIDISSFLLIDFFVSLWFHLLLCGLLPSYNQAGGNETGGGSQSRLQCRYGQEHADDDPAGLQRRRFKYSAAPSRACPHCPAQSQRIRSICHSLGDACHFTVTVEHRHSNAA